MNHEHHDLPKKNLKTYWPLILVLLFIIGGTYYLGHIRGDSNWMPDFMGLFFVVFSFFKLLDIPGFAHAYKSYDIPTKALPTWGYIYPFVELTLGILYLTRTALFETNIAVLIILGISIIGVIQSVIQKKKIKCACLGTGFNLPMSQVTIIEDGVMILMAVVMLVG